MDRELLRERMGKDRDGWVERQLRHATMHWHEWALHEFLRYVYLLGVLALVLMGPLQMAAAWLPFARPPVMEASVVGAIALTFVLSVVYLSFLGYRYLWSKGGYVDRAVRAREPTSEEEDAGRESRD